MSGFDLLEAVGGVDPAYVEHAETAAVQFRRWERTVRIVAAVAACAAVAIVAAGVTTGKHSIHEPDSLYGEEGSVVRGTEGAGNTVEPSVADITGTDENVSATEPSVAVPASGTGSAPVTQNVSATDPSTEKREIATEKADDGGYSGGVTTPAAYAETTSVVRGTGYTAEEIAELLRRDGYGIAQAAAAETSCSVGDVRILTSGYCHTSLGTENVVDLDYLTLPVCVGDRVIASVDLFRVDGEVHYSVSAGGSRWNDLNLALAYGEVAFVYAGYGELAVAADGTVFDITADASQSVAQIEDLYALACSPYTVFSLSALQSADYVSPGT